MERDKEFATLTKAVRFAANEIMPFSKLSMRKSPFWLTADAISLIKKKNAAWRKFKSCRSLENAVLYRRANALMKRQIKMDKKQSWISFTNSISPENGLEENWRKVKKVIGKDRRPPNFALHGSPNPITNPVDIAENIATFLSRDMSNDIHPVCKDNASKYQKDKPRLFRQPHRPLLNHPITQEELEHSIQSLKSTAPGLDKITFGILKHTTASFRIRLLALFNSIMTSGRFPHQWKLAEVRPIPKEPSSLLNIDQFRPISLLNTSSKLLEKILAVRLNWLLEQKLSHSIAGFRPSRGCLTLLQEMQHNLACALSSRQHSVILSIDLDKAFDRVLKHPVILQLNRWHVGRRLLKSIDTQRQTCYR